MSEREINLEEMANVSGGKGGSRTMLPHREGYLVYQIRPRENLTVIARNFHTTVDEIFFCNETITNKNDITAGYWIYIPEEENG